MRDSLNPVRLTPTDYALSASNPWSLSPRECAVMRCLSTQAESLPQASHLLGSSEKTVNAYLRSARRKMGFPNKDDQRIWMAWVESLLSPTQRPTVKLPSLLQSKKASYHRVLFP
jgi:DNA-binding CsgD family transcriptional regulator